MDISNLTSLRHLSTVNTFKFLALDRSGIWVMDWLWERLMNVKSSKIWKTSYIEMISV
jgi:hypothetical protein